MTPMPRKIPALMLRGISLASMFGSQRTGGHTGINLYNTTAEVGGTNRGERNVISGLPVGVSDTGGELDGNFIGTRM